MQTTVAMTVDRDRGPEAPAVEENLQAIADWEQSALLSRSPAARLGDAITAGVASGPALIGHAIWFLAWGAINLELIPAIEPFDPFPFPLLTMAVSLEAIFLSLLVLASQNRMSRQTDKRAHLNLQIDLLAEREMTAVLRLLTDIASHLGVSDTLTPAELRDLARKTDIRQLTDKLEAIPNADSQPAATDGQPTSNRPDGQASG